MIRGRDEHGIESEPHLHHAVVKPPQRVSAQETSRDAVALDREHLLDRSPHSDSTEVDQEEIIHSVWDEPVHDNVAGTSSFRLDYANWLLGKIESTTALQSWLVTLAVAALSGPLGVAGAFIEQLAAGQGFAGLTVIVIAPVTEEVMKAALVMWILEKRPYLFKHGWQIGVCLLMSGLAFAAIENVIYLNVYIADPAPEIIRWRWTICVLLHTGCAMITSIGIIWAWQVSMTTRRRPRLTNSTPFLIAAIVVHAMYNAAALLFVPFYSMMVD